MKSFEVVACLGALAQESRLAVHQLLVKRGPGGFTPGQIATRLGIPAPTLSFHLKELQRVGLIGVRREGRNLHYFVDFQRMQGLMRHLTEKCCSLADQECAEDCSTAPRQRRRACA